MQQTSKSRRIFTILLLFSSLFCSLVLAEGALRIFYPQRIYYNISQWDPHVGFAYVPNIEGYSKTNDYIMHVKINSRGLRDRQFGYAKHPNSIRIGIFGDSFTFGEGVQDNETYPKILESILNNGEDISRTGVNVEVLNFGIGKSGTSHQLAWYQEEGQKYDLDMVILGFLSGNDFEDNWPGVFCLKENELVHNPQAYSSIRKLQKIVHQIPFYKWVATHSHLANFLRKMVTIYDDKRRTAGASNSYMGEADQDGIDSKKFQLTVRLIDEFQEKASHNNSCFMLVNLPAKGQKLLSEYADGQEIPPYVVKCDTLLQALNKNKMKALDLVPVFSSLDESLCYFKHEGHMTKFGHQVIASSIQKAILPVILQIISETREKERV